MRGITPYLVGSVALVAMGLSVSSFAQSVCSNAELRDVVGNVLVSDKNGMVSGTEKQSLAGSNRVTTTSRSSATVAFSCGCDVKLKENERLDIGGAPTTCAVFLAAVSAVPVGAAIGAVAVSSAGATGGVGALAAAGAGLSAYLLYRQSQNQSGN